MLMRGDQGPVKEITVRLEGGAVYSFKGGSAFVSVLESEEKLGRKRVIREATATIVWNRAETIEKSKEPTPIFEVAIKNHKR